MTDLTIEQRVAAGAAWLDEQVPSWLDLIDLYTLRLDDGCRCILGQTFGDYGLAPLAGAPDEEFDEDEGRYFLGEIPDEYDAAAAVLGFQSSEVSASRPLKRPILQDVRDREYGELTAEWKRLILSRREAVSQS